jgi:hypothetical protein
MNLTQRGEIWVPFCSKCGSQMPEESRFCPNCGQDATKPVTVPPTQRIPEQQVTQRPTGVTILAVLQVLGGLFFFGLGTLMLAFAGFVGIAGLIPDIPMFPALVGGAVLGVIGGIMLVIGILGFAVAYGYWNGRGWAWTLGMVITVISLILGLSSLPEGALGLIINALIIYYLTRPYVKRWFGKKPVPFTV